ncbi:MAG: TIGR00159 family protein [Bacteroidetes bacterium]|nr:MAG: TIGR00159 family protein [Bacteroidota bacterium]
MELLFGIGFLEIKWVDVVDILAVTFLLYQLYQLVRGTVALKIFSGFLSLYILFLFVQATQMELLTAILSQFMGVGVIAALILFQQEIRRFLLLIGNSANFNDLSVFKFFKQKSEKPHNLNPLPIVEAMKIMGRERTGALIILSKSSEMSNYITTGDLIDAFVSKRLLISIFNKLSPLHDGAVIIIDDRIKAARCTLPVSENQQIPPSMGMRHKAGIGISEVTDTLVLLVSEQTGNMAIAQNGKIYTELTSAEVRRRIDDYLQNKHQEQPKNDSQNVVILPKKTPLKKKPIRRKKRIKPK